MDYIPFLSGGVSFNPRTDIPSSALHGKTILVTGGNAGLGKQSILEFVRQPAASLPSRIWLCSRSLERAQSAIDDISAAVQSSGVNPDFDASSIIKPLELDLTSFDSIKSAARTVLAESDRLDILMLNAGIMAAATGVTAEGYEIQFGTNHVGHALLTKLLLPLLLKTARSAKGNDLPQPADGTPTAPPDVRVVVLSSEGHRLPPLLGINFATLKSDQSSMLTWQRYGQSKLANILFGKQLAAHYPEELTVVALHPGAVNTQLFHPFRNSGWIGWAVTGFLKFFLSTVEDGAKNQVWAATAPREQVQSEGKGKCAYFLPVGKRVGESGWAKDEELASKLWQWTEGELEGQEVDA
ncbi:hypothetical protein NEUTE1DRAFT_66636 [Neurospora tetrasperma FGSC 2508]|uniref:NAD(P)-binding protein n=1 Tax=Neurospora tetrasperma (strain FGSC 2508 / ATCC MYA-4615 / P0657) TaxID=510951 RepID=F8MT62_NEUT8|nr:uncharacterized protein NEUTE1DRAFT_66636 [Neurospora tetrasperma FGSC 2508]EGO55194.1 hypothetical protein NEUTE1DRAFT_66636 [Neurospora tetrasperma FGSC 2508]EGZ69588.1 NAD(P)-binding protein [Neurospora tetrasperma FGSC 2509]